MMQLVRARKLRNYSVCSRYVAARQLTSTPFIVDSIETVDSKMKLLQQAQDEFATFDQQKVNHIFKSVAHAANKQRIYLAQLAAKDVGCMEDKVIKNAVACELTLGKYLGAKTVGIIEEDPIRKLTKYAVPVGPVASIIPMTNPTSTVITKALFALKTRNAMMFLPHPRSTFASSEATRICAEAAVKAGAPANILQCVNPDRAVSNHVMHHPVINLLVATGGPSMVQACYASGKPALGVGR